MTPSTLEHAGPGRAGLRALAIRLGSPRLALWMLAAVAGGVLAGYLRGGSATWVLVASLAAFAVNLACAIGTHPVFRREGALLVFHVALLAVVVLLAAGRLTSLKGHVELSEGEAFAGRLVAHEAGPLHRWRLDRVTFTNLGFTIDYAPGVRRGRTANRIAWESGGRALTAEIGDSDPLVVEGYRFYTSFNKGYAPVFDWLPRGGGEAVRGSVHLPAYPLHEHGQALEWTPPGSRSRIWTHLQIDTPVLDPARASQFRIPESHRIIVRVGDARHELVPGARVELPEGTLVYRRLSTWMGYTVFHDWTIPWLLATCLLGVASLGWHFWRRFAARPWQGDGSC